MEDIDAALSSLDLSACSADDEVSAAILIHSGVNFEGQLAALLCDRANGLLEHAS